MERIGAPATQQTSDLVPIILQHVMDSEPSICIYVLLDLYDKWFYDNF